MLPRFHLAFPVSDLESTRKFYVNLLGATVGRESERWIDFDFFGHQISAHLAAEVVEVANPVDGDVVPVPHFGVILDIPTFLALAERLSAAEVPRLIGPRVRFQGGIGEQHTMFVRDPSGNTLEFKAFANDQSVFAR
jgi:uncharacterized protein